MSVCELNANNWLRIIVPGVQRKIIDSKQIKKFEGFKVQVAILTYSSVQHQHVHLSIKMLALEPYLYFTELESAMLFIPQV